MSAFGYTRYGQKFGVAVNDAGTRLTDKQLSATDRLAAVLFTLGAGKGLENNFQWLYPFVGGTQVAHSFNLADPSNKQIFFEDDTTVIHDHNGITGPGNVQLFPFDGTITIDEETGESVMAKATVVQTCCAFGVYCRSGPTSSNMDLKAQQVAPLASVYHGIVCRRPTSGDAVFYHGLPTTSGYVVVVVATAQGFFCAMRQGTATAQGILYVYRNGVAIGSNAALGGAVNQEPFYLLGGGSHNLAFAYLTKHNAVAGLPFSSVMQTSFYNAVQKFQTALARQV